MDQKVERENGQGIGALLKASRLRCGEELDDVAAILRIRRAYLEAIEEGRFADLPGSTYAVGFIRAYAEHLGLDSNEVVRRFKSSDAQPARAKQELTFPVPVSEAGVPGGAIVFVGVLVAVVAYGAWYLSSTKDGFFAELVSPLPDRLASLANQPPANAPPVSKENPSSATVAVAATLPDRASDARPEAAPAPAPAEVRPVEVANLPDVTPKPVSAETKSPAPLAGTSQPAEPVATPNPVSPEASPESAKTEKADPTPPVATTSPESAKIDKVEPTSTATARVETKAVEAAPVETAAQSPVPTAGRPGSESENKPVVKTEKAPEVADLTPSGRSIDAPYRPDADAASTSPVAERSAPVLAKAIPKPEPKPTAPASAASTASRIVVRAKANSWIQVRDDVDNQLLLTRLLRAGDTYPVPNRSGLMLLTGNASALEIQVDGETVPGIGGGAVRRAVALDIERLRQGKAVVD